MSLGLVRPYVSKRPAVLQLAFSPGVVVVLRKLRHQIRQIGVQRNPAGQHTCNKFQLSQSSYVSKLLDGIDGLRVVRSTGIGLSRFVQLVFHSGNKSIVGWKGTSDGCQTGQSLSEQFRIVLLFSCSRKNDKYVHQHQQMKDIYHFR